MQNSFTQRGFLLEYRRIQQQVTEAALQGGTHMNFLERKIEGVVVNCLGAVKWQNCCAAFSRFIRIFSEYETKLWWVIGSSGR